jgi:hypothetical protein
MNHPALLTELQTDPRQIGYAGPLAIGDQDALAAMLNAITGPGAATVTLASVPHDAFELGLAPALLGFSTLSATIQAKWQPILAALNSSTNVTINAETIGLLSTAVTDGVMTTAQATAIYQRTGSRAEVLFGAGTVVLISDVSAAVRGLQ